jgi:hypothetical protein
MIFLTRKTGRHTIDGVLPVRVSADQILESKQVCMIKWLN